MWWAVTSVLMNQNYVLSQCLQRQAHVEHSDRPMDRLWLEARGNLTLDFFRGSLFIIWGLTWTWWDMTTVNNENLLYYVWAGALGEIPRMIVDDNS